MDLEAPDCGIETIGLCVRDLSGIELKARTDQTRSLQSRIGDQGNCLKMPLA